MSEMASVDHLAPQTFVMRNAHSKIFLVNFRLESVYTYFYWKF